jgi:hypothetical protein
MLLQGAGNVRWLDSFFLQKMAFFGGDLLPLAFIEEKAARADRRVRSMRPLD